MNSEKKKHKNKGRKPGGHKGHIDRKLNKVDTPAEQLGFPTRSGSLFNFSPHAYEASGSFETIVKLKLIEAALFLKQLVDAAVSSSKTRR